MTEMQSGREIVAEVRGGRITARAVAEAAAARIAASRTNAVVDFDPAEGIAAADAVDARLARGEDLQLAGLPVVIKDLIWVAGRRVTAGSLLHRDFRPPVDALAVERLKAAGAVIMGMANTSEFGCKGVTTNRVYGPTLHPLDPDLTPGGSSGGPAAAVAEGLVPVAIGTDAGGSSRRPPAHCGVVGFKPSQGAIADGPSFPETVPGISVIAPITRDVADAAMVFEVLAGIDPRDPGGMPIANAEAEDPKRLRIAFAPRFGLDVPVDDDVAAAIETAAGRLAAYGWRIDRRDPVWPAGLGETTLMPLQHAGLAALHGDVWRATPDLFDPDIAVQIEAGLRLDETAVARARRASAAVAPALAAFFNEVDLLIGPTVPCPPWPWRRLGPERIGGVEVAARAHAVFTPLFNHALVPAITLPCGVTPAGLPVGLQIVAARGRDRRLLAAATEVERILAAG